eukprot:COSAG04_NODE_596_length_12255_cov_4.614018_12_plen_435_part_00
MPYFFQAATDFSGAAMENAMPRTRARGEPSPPPQQPIGQMSNDELRAELQDYGRPTGGKKAELKARLSLARTGSEAAGVTPRASPPLPAPRRGRAAGSPSPPLLKATIAMTNDEMRDELAERFEPTSGTKGTLRQRLQGARRRDGVSPSPTAVAPRSTARSPQPATPAPTEELGDKELRRRLGQAGLDDTGGTEELRARLQDHYKSQAELLRTGTAGQAQTGFERRLESLPTDLGAHEQRQAAAAAPRRSAPRTLAFDEQPSPASPADSFTSAAEDALSPEGQPAQAAPGPDPAHGRLADAAEDLADAAASLAEARQDRLLNARDQARVRANEKQFPLVAREVAAGRESVQLLTNVDRARNRERYLERLMGLDRRRGRDHDAKYTVRRAAPAVDSGEAALLAARSVPGQIPGARVWQRPRFADVSLMPVEQTVA